MGYALWLIPAKGRQYDVLSREIEDISAEHKSTSFLPHATLVSGLDCQDVAASNKVWDETVNVVRAWKEHRASQGAETKSLTVELENVSTKGTFYQCVFILLQKDPSLLSLHQDVKSTLGRDQDPPYMPHISLLYADLKNSEAQMVIESVKQKGKFQREPHFAFQGLQEVNFDTVELWECNSPVAKWKCVKSRSIGEM